MATLRLGIAIGADSVTAVWRGNVARSGGTQKWSAELRGGPTRDELQRTLTELSGVLGNPRGVLVSVAILPPLARVRRIELPRMSNDDRRLATARAAERHFLGLGESVLCAVQPLGRGTRAVAPFLAAAVAAGLAADVTGSITELGWTVDRIVPAQSAWTTAACLRWPELRRGAGRIVVPGPHEATVLQLESGTLAMVRRFRSVESATKELEGSTNVRVKSITVATDELSPAAVAARNAAKARRLELVPDTERQARANGERRVVRRLAGIAAALVIGATAAYRVGLTRQLHAVAAQRAALRAQVDRAMAARDSLATLAQSAAAIRALEQSAPRWSAVLSRIAIALPTDASLAVVRGDADSLSMEGQAANAASVFSTLRSAPGIVDVRSNAPIRQELLTGQGPTERWTLLAHVAHSAAARERE